MEVSIVLSLPRLDNVRTGGGIDDVHHGWGGRRCEPAVGAVLVPIPAWNLIFFLFSPWPKKFFCCGFQVPRLPPTGDQSLGSFAAVLLLVWCVVVHDRCCRRASAPCDYSNIMVCQYVGGWWCLVDDCGAGGCSVNNNIDSAHILPLTMKLTLYSVGQ